MHRLMAIDFGEVRIGIALSDPLQIIAKPFEVIKNSNDEKVWNRLKQIIDEKTVGRIILGLPLNLKGEDTQKTLEVRNFASELKKRIKIPIIFQDERYTSVDANEALKAMGYTIKESREVIDMVAASIILKNFMLLNQ